MLRGRDVNGRLEPLSGPKRLRLSRAKNNAVHLLRRILHPQLLDIHDMKQSPVVVLMHRLRLLAPQPPRPVAIARQGTERLQQIRDIPPSYLQPLQRIAPTPQIPPKHQVQRHVLRVPGHHQSRRHVLRALKALAAVIINHDEQPAWQALSNPRREDQSSTHVHRVPLTLLRARASHAPHLAIGITPRPPHRVHSIARPIILHQVQPRSERRDILRERERVPSKLPQARTRHRHEVHLHVLQRHEHRLHHRRPSKEIPQVVHGKPEARIHVIIRRPQRDDLTPFLVTPLVAQLFVQVSPTPQARARTAERRPIRSIQRRQLVPRRHLHATRGHAGSTPLQDFHVLCDRRRRRERGVERRETLLTVIARKQNHTRENRVHRLHCP